MENSRTLDLVYVKPRSGDASKPETMAKIETVLAQSHKNMHCTSAESNILKTSSYRTLNSEIPKCAYLFKYCKR